MSQLQQGRANAKRVIRKPKSFAKAQKMYDELPDDTNVVRQQDKEWAPKYSRITKKLINKK